MNARPRILGRTSPALVLNRYLPLSRILLPLLALCIPACSSAADGQHSPLQRVDRFTEVMGTTFSVSAYVSDPELAQNDIEAAFAEARRIDRLLSNYKPDSELSSVNKHAAEAPVQVSGELFSLLQTCMQVSRRSDGAFDITVGPLMKLWGFYRDEGHVPNAQAVSGSLKHVGYRYVRLDPEQGTVRFLKAGLELDPGGVGKGYAIDRMAAVLIGRGFHSALLSAGGSSIYAIGTPPDDARGWKISIEDPLESGKSATSVYLKDASLSTSGGYEKFFESGGRKYSHIMDPRTGYPVQGMLAVSVVCPHTLDSEIWAKPFYVLGRAWTEQHLQPGFQVFLCDDSGKRNCSWIRPGSAS
jgi:FAD:protein FMN transferase